jgi:hypothetical protein
MESQNAWDSKGVHFVLPGEKWVAAACGSKINKAGTSNNNYEINPTEIQLERCSGAGI